MTGPHRASVIDAAFPKQRHFLEFLGEVGAPLPAPPLAGMRTCGYGQWKTIRVAPPRRREFFALYVFERQVWFLAERRCYAVTPRCTARRISWGIGKTFTFRDHDQMLYKASYWGIDQDEWPDNGDLFTYIEANLKGPQQLRRFLFFQQAVSEGRDVQSKDFDKELKQFIETG